MRWQVFCEKLKVETAQAHRSAESRPFIRDLMAGHMNRRAYARYIWSLLPVYDTLERCMQESTDSTIAIFDHRGLDRSTRMQADLQRFGLLHSTGTLESTKEYASAIQSAATSPQRLLAHHYTRYLGDMAGGQAISRLMQRHYDIDASYLSFYDFSELGDLHHYRKQYKLLLDLLPWSPTEQAEFIGESESAYWLNVALFDELAELCGNAEPPDSCGKVAHSFLANERHHAY